VVWSRPLPEGASPSTVTVSQDAAGRWYVALLVEDPTVGPLPATGTAVGVDVGVEHLLTLSTGEKVTNPPHERRDRARLAKAQRQLARKAKGDGANRRKARSPRSMPASPTAGATSCTSSPLGSFVKTKRS
jgi:putative transposase